LVVKKLSITILFSKFLNEGEILPLDKLISSNEKQGTKEKEVEWTLEMLK